MSAFRALRLKVKREAYPWLNAAAMEVNTVWNWANETSAKAARPFYGKPKWLTGFNLCALSAGTSVHMKKIGAATIQRVCSEFALKRSIANRQKLKWRSSTGSRRSLGWVPFKGETIRALNTGIRFLGKNFRVFQSGLLVGMKWKDGSFAQDACGDWWLCLPVEYKTEQNAAPREAVGIDLGLKATATTSDGDTLEAGRFYRGVEQKIAQAQRRGHKRQAKRLHRQAANRRKDALHKFSRKIVDTYQNIVVGDVSSTKLAKTRMAKSVLDSGWGMLKTQLLYKGQQAGRSVQVVSERNTTRACSGCGCLSGPNGLAMLSVRRWACADCGESHDRDVNAARNILRRAEVSVSVCGNEQLRGVAA